MEPNQSNSHSISKCRSRFSLVRTQLSHSNIKANKTAWVQKFHKIFEFEEGTKSLKNKTLFITGASRGIGLEIALKAAQQGANIAIVAKTVTPQANLPGTIHTAAEEIEKAGGKALAIQCDIRSEESVQSAVQKTVERFGGIDVLVNNASAISPTGTAETSMKKYDLMHSINHRGTFLCTKYCLPFLQKAQNPHILSISPPLNFEERFVAPFPAYALSKYGMSILTFGFSGEFKSLGIAANCLWPRTSIATAAVQNILGGEEGMRTSRTPEIMADAALVVLNSKSSKTTGNFFVDDEVLASTGVKYLEKYNCVQGIKNEDLMPDFFL